MTGDTHKLSRLTSGLRVITEAVPSVRSVALGMWVGTGSRNETPDQAGISHFLEHLLFKGTEKRTATEIAQVFDGMGGSLNAATSKETTQVHARFLDTHIDLAFEVMSDMVLGPTYPDIDAEREVILEEIAMYEDDPQDKVHDVLGHAIFGDHPLGRPILGSADVISSIPVSKVGAYHDGRYTAQNIVVAAAGNLEHDAIVKLAERWLASAEGAAPERGGDAPAEPSPRTLFSPKDTEQYHICLGGPGISRSDERRYALAVLDSIFGGATSSRLFQEIREKRGLAYAVGSYSEQYVDTGVVALYVGTREDNAGQACEIIGQELDRLPGSVTDEELVRAKEHVKGRLVLSMESTAARMARLGKATLLDIPLLSLDEMLARIDSVSLQDLHDLADAFYAPARLSAACIGRDEERFRTAIAGVSHALAA